ncbi:hypothetical protein CA267_004620 [Alteromonas pelagimontana]|uniref:Uncharacterized protein n=1 Tax=Alteromonas pelagimontana TaxID=1858656 RepID=A0A6M4MAB3_9ALTE|nr:hypothetical protein [Alteromonas pelagimontana]QJR80112.1 hypothetical protein CA267_004620 [Alteromonas pelagimontana]
MINQVEQIAAEAGMSIHRAQAMTAGNHWYNKDSLAIFLLPDNPAGASDIFRQDLIHNFIGENCSGLSLRLMENGNYDFVGKDSSLLGTGPLNGTWKYRQYPYLELKKQGSQYADHYFEISRFTDRDKVSEIVFIKLSPMNVDDFADNCVFLYGLRQ